MSWQDYYDAEESRKNSEMEAQTLSELLEHVKQGLIHGAYPALFRAIAQKGDLATSGWILYGVLELPEDSLIRYHAADALLQLCGPVYQADGKALDAGDLSSDGLDTKPANLATIRQFLSEKIGARPGSAAE